MGSQHYRLGFDIGGTFTDFVMLEEATGKMHLHKSLTTPDDPSRAVVTGLSELFDVLGATGEDVSLAIHGTTLMTNALIERKGAPTALITTEGFRDILEMGTEMRYDVYDLYLEKPEPLVPRRLRLELPERLDKDGNVLVPLRDEDIDAVADALRDSGVKAVAVTFLHSFRNDAHEQRVLQRLKEKLPEVTVCISSAVAPEIREFERTSTTVANAYVQPLTAHYLDNIVDGLNQRGYDKDMFMMLSSGGITTVETAKEFPIRLVESGPAAGALAGAFFAKVLDEPNLVAFDMGGTTAKACVVLDGEAAKTNAMEIARVRRFQKGSGLTVRIPVIELIEIGAGGGSIAHVDGMGLLKVGPHSAGAQPGPASYGLGGDDPTVTDANVVLGYLNPGYFLGGRMQLDVAAAKAAIDAKVAGPLGLTTVEGARGIYQVVSDNMMSAIKVHVAEKGKDLRRFTLFATGGAGPLHAYEIARNLKMRRVVSPLGAGAMSALGFLATPVSFDFSRSLMQRLDRLPMDQLQSVFDQMEEEGRQVLRRAGIADQDMTFFRRADLRHKGQGHEVTTAFPNGPLANASVAQLSDLFYAAHTDLYGHAHRHIPVELMTCRLTAVGYTPPVQLEEIGAGTSLEEAQTGTRSAYFIEIGDFVETPVYDRYKMGEGLRFHGPAIVEERESTTIIGPSASVLVDRYRNLIIDLER